MNKKNGKNQEKDNHERGTALVLALLLTTGMLILSMPFLTKLSGQYRVSENSYRSFAALNLAEAGLERAIWELNYGDISSWAGDGLLRTCSLSSVQAPGGTINFDSNIPFYGAVYMPEADLIFSSNIEFHGSAIGNSIVLNSNVDLSYAGELQDIEGLPLKISCFSSHF